MMTHSVNISPKGQVILPKAVRNLLKIHHIIFEIVDEIITLKPLLSVKGSLTKYQINHQDIVDVREHAWHESLNDRSL